MSELEPSAEVLDAWQLRGAAITRLHGGHINATFVVRAPDGAPTAVLQRLNPIFAPEVNLDIQVVCERLASRGVTSPQLIATRHGRPWALDEAGGCWRLVTHIAGHTVERCDGTRRCREAGRMLGRFHAALWDLEHTFAHRRPGVHDTPRHLRALEDALARGAAHRMFAVIQPLGRAILDAAKGVEPPRGLPQRVVHGDPKITNLIFDAAGRAVALIDLDTVARMPLPLELGDALRSWCCPRGEEREGPIDLSLVAAALEGYAAGVAGLPTAAEIAGVAPAVRLIAVELAARFCADALEERYFGWDRARFGSAAEHNLVRARAQLSVARSVARRLSAMEALVARTLTP